MPRLAVLYVVAFSLYLLVALSPTATASPPPGLILANVYDGPRDLRDYWISEKLDGVRAYWDGSRFLSRQGNVFNAPKWFTEDFPAIPLDGELWMGRGTFDVLSGAVRQYEPDPALWRRIRYMVFDLPDVGAPFTERLAQLEKIVAESPSAYLAGVGQFRVKSQDALQRKLEAVVAQGGEGLMLHRGSSLYRAARNDDLLKLKSYEDAEAVVIGHLPGKGKYEGMLGSLLVETPDELQFRVGTGLTDEQRASPPAIGTTITYKYFGKTNKGTPRFASFLRIREPGL